MCVKMKLLLVLVLLHIAECTNQNMKCKTKLDVSTCTRQVDRNNSICNEAPFCRKQFNISYVHLDPYTWEVVADLVRTCCGPCTNITQTNDLTQVSQLTPSLLTTSHFVFPILGRADSSNIYGLHFIPLIETSNIIFITRKKENLMSNLIISCLNMWPLLLTCLLMIAMSGFVCWILETWSNKEEFGRSFWIGWVDGMWWSFISMTTVGYGDKTPKLLVTRVFALVWIIIGITTFSLVTAALTSEITAANSLPPPIMSGARVGAVRHRLYEAIIVAKEGGIIVDIERSNMTDGIKELVSMLKTQQIDGFVLDRYTLLLFKKFFDKDLRYGDDVKFLRTQSVSTEIKVSDKYLYGFLVKDDEDHEFLFDFVKDNSEVLNTCNQLLINKYSANMSLEAGKASLFSPSGEMFISSTVAMIVCIFGICCFGIIYQRRRKSIPLLSVSIRMAP